MRKLLVALMMVAFAATAFAGVSLSGSYEVTGAYKSNLDLDDAQKEKGGSYDHDFDLWINATAGKSFFKSKIEVVDTDWVNGTKGNARNESTNFLVERAWLGHNFGAVKLEAGLMDGAAWGYSFGNAKTGKYRVKTTINAGAGKVIAFVQKNKESFDGTKDSEKDDNDKYGLGYKAKFGGVTVAPLFTYMVNSADGNKSTDDAKKQTSFDIALGGNFGAVGVEFEFDYDKYDNPGDDYNLYGVYANVFGKMAGATVGFATAYGSSDDDSGKNYAFEDDFDFMLILGDETSYGGASDGLAGVWGSKVYADYALNDKMGVSGALAYFKSNIKDDDTTGMELDLGFSYAISEALEYTADFGYAALDFDGKDDTNAMILKHGLAISF